MSSSSLSLSPASQTLSNYPDDYCRAHLCTWLVAGLEPGIISFHAQIANHYKARRPYVIDLEDEIRKVN